MLHLRLLLTQSRLTALLPSFLHARWSCFRLNDGPNIKLVDLFKLVLAGPIVLSVAWSFGVQMVVFFCSGISVVFFSQIGVSGCHNMLFLSSPPL